MIMAVEDGGGQEVGEQEAMRCLAQFAGGSAEI